MIASGSGKIFIGLEVNLNRQTKSGHWMKYMKTSDIEWKKDTWISGENPEGNMKGKKVYNGLVHKQTKNEKEICCTHTKIFKLFWKYLWSLNCNILFHLLLINLVFT